MCIFGCACHDAHVAVREQPAGVNFLLPSCGFRILNSQAYIASAFS